MVNNKGSPPEKTNVLVQGVHNRHKQISSTLNQIAVGEENICCSGPGKNLARWLQEGPIH